MPIEAFIEVPETGERFAYDCFTVPGSGQLYCSYPHGPGNFEAFIVHFTGDDTAEVYEVEDGNSLELSMDTDTFLPDNARRSDVTRANSFRKEVVSPQGIRADLVVRTLIEVTEV